MKVIESKEQHPEVARSFRRLTPKGPKAIFRPFLKSGQAIVKAISIKNS
jgi:hypothetical protein